MSKPRVVARGSSKATPPPGPMGLRARLSWWWHAPSGVLIASIVLVLVTTIAFGATRPNTGNPPAPGASASPLSSPRFEPRTSPPALLPAPELPDLLAEIERIERKYDALAGVALSQSAQPLGAGQDVWLGGHLRSGDALATIDVAMALAVLAEPRQPQQRDYIFNRALVDGSAAGDDALWAFLGDAEEAAAKTTRLLRTHGDWRTQVSSASDSHPDAPYLATQWTLAEQARFAGTLYCGGYEIRPVLSLLDRPTDDAWGLQVVPLAYAKGAVGEAANGDTVVRQFGLLPLAGGHSAGIAVLVSGDIEPDEGRSAVTELVAAVGRLAAGVEPAAC